ncbi:efflux RND transporter periplasmic adaptor subunit, partial [Microbacterium sp. AISO3]|uniref:efflux RND transporter periplasmic adaptor subunit n=1 Tax=Microbacterium sp. AISO3 TaxID=2002831 RepID=UPI00112FFC75
IWIVVSLYEYDLSSVVIGDEADIQLPYDPNKLLKGKISYIYPEIEVESRTAKARIEMPNPDEKLKPGMFANVEVKKNLGEAIVIPDDAVIDTGVRRIVFVRTESARFEPREVKIGARVGQEFTVPSGLN